MPDDLRGIDGIIYPLEKEPIEIDTKALLIVDIPRGIISEKVIAEKLKKFKEKLEELKVKVIEV